LWVGMRLIIAWEAIHYQIHAFSKPVPVYCGIY
jgi:hypothetical protein